MRWYEYAVSVVAALLLLLLALLVILACGCSPKSQVRIDGLLSQYTDSHGISVASMDTDGDGKQDHLIDRASFESLVDGYLLRWETATGWRDTRSILQKYKTGVVFRERPFPCGISSPTGLCDGLAWPWRSTVHVGYVDPISKSALGYELLRILTYYHGIKEGEEERVFIRDHGLWP